MEVGRRSQGGWRGRAAWMAMSLACSLAPSGVAFDRRPLVGLAVPTYDMTTTTTPDAPKGKEGPLNNRRSRDVPPLRLARVVNPVAGSRARLQPPNRRRAGRIRRPPIFRGPGPSTSPSRRRWGAPGSGMAGSASAGGDGRSRRPRRPLTQGLHLRMQRFDRNSVVWKQMEARRWARERPNQSGQRDEWGQVQLQCHSTAPWGPGRCSAPGQTAAMPAQDSVRSPITRGLRRRTENFDR